jgi:predicted PurR-regulated permease PerM
MTDQAAPAMTDHNAAAEALGPAPEAAAPVRHYQAMQVPSAAAVLAAVVTLAVAALLLLISEQILVFVIGLILAFLMDPLVTWLARHRVPRGLATLLVMVAVAAVLVLLAKVFLETVINQAASLVAALPESFDHLRAWVASSGLGATVQADLTTWLDGVEKALLGLDLSVLVRPVFGILGNLVGSFFTLLALPFFLFYVLAGRPALTQAIDASLPSPWMTDIQTVVKLGLDSGGTYVRAEATVAVILGFLTWVSLMLFSVAIDPAFAEVALLLAIIAAFSELIPNFGPWIAAIPAVLFALTISPAAAGATIILYIVLMFVEGQVLVPKIEGGAFSFHPAVVLFIVVAGIGLLGLLGAILALPVTAWAWRSVRYAFRRATGLPAGMATALGVPQAGVITAPTTGVAESAVNPMEPVA